MWMKFTVAGLLLSVAAPSFANEEEHRQHGAHVHGSGQMNVALSDTQLMLALSIPAHDLIGFEHEPKTPEDHEKLDKAVARLQDAAALFTPNAEADCTLTSAEVKSKLLDQESHGEEHDGEEHHDEDEHEHDGHAEDHHEEQEAHSEFDLEYEFSCQKPDQLKQLTLNLFQVFPGIEILSVQLIGPAGQRGSKLTPQSAVLSLR